MTACGAFFIYIPGFHGDTPALEGKRQYDPALLLPANAAYKKHLDAVWKALVRLRD